jgi:hypothetical protein
VDLGTRLIDICIYQRELEKNNVGTVGGSVPGCPRREEICVPLDVKEVRYLPLC